MNQIEFGKEIQRLDKKLFDKVEKNLNFKIDLETGEINSYVYSGKDYPKERKELITFLDKKIDLYMSPEEYENRVNKNLVYLFFEGKGWTDLAFKTGYHSQQTDFFGVYSSREQDSSVKVKHIRDGGNFSCKWYDSLPFLVVNLLINHYLDPEHLNWVNVMQEPGNVQLSTIGENLYITEFLGFYDDYRQITDINELKKYSSQAMIPIDDCARTIINDIREQKEFFLIRDGQETVDIVIKKAIPTLELLLKKKNSKLTKKEEDIVSDYINNYRQKNITYETNYELIKQKFIGKNVVVNVEKEIGYFDKEHNVVYPVNCGYVRFSSIGDIDAYILGEYKPTKKFKGSVVAVLRKSLDEALVVAEDGKKYTEDQIKMLVDFLRIYFKSEIIM